MNRSLIITNESIRAVAESAVRNLPINADRPIEVAIREYDTTRRNEANKYYWGVVIKSICEQAWIDGQQFGKDAWHEQAAQMFGIKEEIRLPNGTLTLRRKSTADMKVREFAKYIEEVCAWAAQELGIRFPAPEWI